MSFRDIQLETGSQKKRKFTSSRIPNHYQHEPQVKKYSPAIEVDYQVVPNDNLPQVTRRSKRLWAAKLFQLRR